MPIGVENVRKRVRTALRNAGIKQIIHPIVERYVAENREKFVPYGVSIDAIINCWIDGYAFQKYYGAEYVELKKVNVIRASDSRKKRKLMEKQNESKE